MKKKSWTWNKDRISKWLEESSLDLPTSVCPCFKCRGYLTKCLTDEDMVKCKKYFRWHYKNGDIDYRRKNRKKLEVLK